MHFACIHHDGDDGTMFREHDDGGIDGTFCGCSVLFVVIFPQPIVCIILSNRIAGRINDNESRTIEVGPSCGISCGPFTTTRSGAVLFLAVFFVDAFL